MKTVQLAPNLVEQVHDAILAEIASGALPPGERIVQEQLAAALGVSPQQIEATLYNPYGGRQISTLYGATDQYNVMVELDPN